MRKTKLSFDLFAQQHGNDGLFARFYRHPGSAILLQSRSQRRPSPRLSASASHHLPLYQDKAVTPTPLKDIFTPIWAGPSYPTTNRPKSQNALRFEIIMTFLYTVVSYRAMDRLDRCTPKGVSLQKDFSISSSSPIHRQSDARAF